MTSRLMFRAIVISFLLVILAVAGSRIGLQTARAQNAPQTDDIPGTGAVILSEKQTLDTGLAPDGTPLSNFPSEPLTIEDPGSGLHPSGIIGLRADQEIPVGGLDLDSARPQGLTSPGDGIYPEVDSSSFEMDNSSSSLTLGTNELSIMALYPGLGFLQKPTSGNIATFVSYIDMPVLNIHSDKVFLATPILDPGGIVSAYHDHPIGAYYSTSKTQWSVFNEDSVNMVASPAFNIFVPPQNGTSFTHTAGAATISNDLTRMDHPSLNNNSSALVFALPAFNPNGVIAGPGYYNHFTGVYYDTASGKWGIYNEDFNPVEENAAFFVYVANTAIDVAFKHTTAAGNISANYTTLDHPKLNGNPNAVVIVQHVYATNRLDSASGVWYNPTTKRWTIYDNSYATMTAGHVFNVLVIPEKSDSFVYKALSSRILPDVNDHVLRIDHPLLDGNPNAQVYVTHNWNPQGDDNHIIDTHPLGVIYTSNKWNIYHTDYEPIPVGATYNVFATNSQLNSYSTKSWSENTTGSMLSLNHPVLNGQPAPVIIETLNFNPGEGSSGFTYPYSSPVYYTAGKWTIYRNTGPAYTSNAYNVFIPGGNKFIHTATAGNKISPAETCIDNPLTNGRRDALLVVSANASPNGVFTSFVNAQLGVFYYVDTRQWCIYTEDLTALPVDASFNVFVGPSKMFLPLIRR